VKHEEISEKITQLLENEKEISKIETKFGIDRALIEFGYNPII